MWKWHLIKAKYKLKNLTLLSHRMTWTKRNKQKPYEFLSPNNYGMAVL